MKKYDMDRIYFRIKRNDKYENVCFSDLTDEERVEVCSNKQIEWFIRVTHHLADCLYEAGAILDKLGVKLSENKD